MSKHPWHCAKWSKASPHAKHKCLSSAACRTPAQSTTKAKLLHVGHVWSAASASGLNTST